MWSRGSVAGVILAVFAMCCSVAWWTGCSESGTEQPGSPDPTTRTIGPEGGVITASGVTLRIPAGALEADVTITITPIGELTPPGYVSRTAAFRFEPSGLVFRAPIEVDFAVEGERSRAKVLWSADGRDFEALPTEVIAEGIRSHVQHFSLGLGAELLDLNVDGGGDGGDGGDAGSTREVLIFSGDDGVHGIELWATDGTSAGTHLLKDFEPGPEGTRLSVLGAVNEAAYFSALRKGVGYELWTTNGTPEGTVMLTAISARENVGPRAVPFDGQLYFWKDEIVDGVTRAACLWRTDGTPAGTVRVSNRVQTGLYTTAVANGSLFFVGTTGTDDDELWKTDGTDPGTVRVKDIRPGATGSMPKGLASFNGAVYLSATDGVAGSELWKSDGTEGGTVMVKDLLAGSGSGFSNGAFAPLDGRLYFNARSSTGTATLWSTDGTTAGTQPVKQIAATPGQYDTYGYTLFNGALYFLANNGTAGPELWRSDGTAAGTTLFKELVPGSYGGVPSSLTVVDGALYFSAHSRAPTPSENAPPVDLWKSDGTEAGTVVVRAKSRLLAIVQKSLYLASDDGTHGVEIWKSDGTPAGTVMVTDLFPGAGSGYAYGGFTVLRTAR